MVALTADKGGDVNEYKTGNHPVPALYHFVVKTAEDIVSKKKGTAGYKVSLEVLAGTMPGQEGKELDETFWVTEGAVPRLVAFALATGVMKAGESADDTILLQTPGHQFVGEVEEEEYETESGKKGKKVRLAYGGIWPIGHPDVANVPLNADALKLAGLSVPAGGGEGGAGGEKQEAKTAGKRKAKVADAEKPAEKEEKAADDWSDVLN